MSLENAMKWRTIIKIIREIGLLESNFLSSLVFSDFLDDFSLIL